MNSNEFWKSSTLYLKYIQFLSLGTCSHCYPQGTEEPCQASGHDNSYCSSGGVWCSTNPSGSHEICKARTGRFIAIEIVANIVLILLSFI